LGYPATTGATFIDYFLSDRVASAVDYARHYSEKLVLLPHCYYVNDHARYHAQEARAYEEAGEAGSAARRLHSSAERKAEGLPGSGTLVANFNQLYKTTPDVFAA